MSQLSRLSRLSLLATGAALVVLAALAATLSTWTTTTALLVILALGLQALALTLGILARPHDADPQSRPAPPVAEGALRVDDVRGRVLLVDDEPRILDALQRALSHLTVDTARSGNQATARLGRGEPWDAVVCDVMMDDGTGLDVLRWIEANRPELRQRIVFLSGGRLNGPVGQFLSRTSHPVLQKPVDMDVLLDALDPLVQS